MDDSFTIGEKISGRPGPCNPERLQIFIPSSAKTAFNSAIHPPRSADAGALQFVSPSVGVYSQLIIHMDYKEVYKLTLIRN